MNLAYTLGSSLLMLGLACIAACWEPSATEKLTLDASLVTDRSASSTAAGPTAVKWGFMCSIAARHGQNLCAINFTRTPDVPWDATTPVETPIAFWRQEPDGRWRSVLLDSPERTYQTPSLLLGPDGRANVFALHPGSGRLFWFQGADPSNNAFERREIAMDWGAYLAGGIDPKGRALLVYWGNGRGDPSIKDNWEQMEDGYRKSTLGYTLVDTRTGKSMNGVIDRPGAPYCYSQVQYARTGAHVLTVRSEVKRFLVANSRNHYTELRYYYSPDPASGAAWRMVPIYQNPKASIQPLGLEVDHAGRVHLLYYYVTEISSPPVTDSGGRALPSHRLILEQTPNAKVTPHKLIYAVSEAPVSDKDEPRFVQHEIKSGWDGRLFQTRNGQVHILTYQAGKPLEYCRVLDGKAGRFTPWTPVETPEQHTRFFPIGARGGSTLTDDLEGVFTCLANTPAQSSLFYFRLPLNGTAAQGATAGARE